jgi:AraC-like DNA-binding protein
MKNRDDYWELKYWRVPHLENLRLLHGVGINYDYPTHMHEEYCVVLMLGGIEITNCRGQNYTTLPGQLMLINADEVHSSTSIKAEYRVIKIGNKALSHIALTLSGHQPERICFPRLIVDDAVMFRALLDLHIKLEGYTSALEQESEFMATIGMLLSRHGQVQGIPQSTNKESNYVTLIRDYVRSHYAENVSLAKLTSITKLSPFHLLRIFKKQVGCPPHEYQTQLRIAHARQLIRDGNAIADVALETGFADQSHFSRNFKRIVGMPPGQYSQSKIIQDKTVNVC